MREFIAAYGVKLAPHGKTTMAPSCFRCSSSRRLGNHAGHCAPDARGYTHGVRRVLMANQLVGKENMAIVAAAA